MADRARELRAFGYRVAGRRYELGMSQETLAEKCGLSKNAIGNMESGLSEPKASSLKSLCCALECSSDYLLYGEQLPADSAAASQLLSLMKDAQGKLDKRKLAFFLDQSRHLLDNLTSL